MSTQPLSLVAETAGDGDGIGWLMSAVETAALASRNWPVMPDPVPAERTCCLRVAVRSPGVNAGSVREARDFTIATARHWGAGKRSDDIAVVVSELLTNALRHAQPEPRQVQPGPAIRLGLIQPGACVLCAVADPSPKPPVRREPDPLAEAGRGLHIVAALSDSWGFVPLGRLGKVVWAMFSVTPRPPHPAVCGLCPNAPD